MTETVGKGLKSNPAEIGLPAETSRNGRNRSEQAEILAEVEHRGDSYRLACRYEIFRPFRPERNGLYNTATNWFVTKLCPYLGDVVGKLGKKKFGFYGLFVILFG